MGDETRSFDDISALWGPDADAAGLKPAPLTGAGAAGADVSAGGNAHGQRPHRGADVTEDRLAAVEAEVSRLAVLTEQLGRAVEAVAGVGSPLAALAASVERLEAESIRVPDREAMAAGVRQAAADTGARTQSPVRQRLGEIVARFGAVPDVTERFDRMVGQAAQDRVQAQEVIEARMATLEAELAKRVDEAAAHLAEQAAAGFEQRLAALAERLDPYRIHAAMGWDLEDLRNEFEATITAQHDRPGQEPIPGILT